MNNWIKAIICVLGLLPVMLSFQNCSDARFGLLESGSLEDQSGLAIPSDTESITDDELLDLIEPEDVGDIDVQSKSCVRPPVFAGSCEERRELIEKFLANTKTFRPGYQCDEQANCMVSDVPIKYAISGNCVNISAPEVNKISGNGVIADVEYLEEFNATRSLVRTREVGSISSTNLTVISDKIGQVEGTRVFVIADEIETYNRATRGCVFANSVGYAQKDGGNTTFYAPKDKNGFISIETLDIRYINTVHLSRAKVGKIIASSQEHFDWAISAGRLKLSDSTYETIEFRPDNEE